MAEPRPDYYAKRLTRYPASYHVNLICVRCRHNRTLPIRHFIQRLGEDATVGDVAARARCINVRYDPVTGAARPPCGGRAEAHMTPASPRNEAGMVQPWC